MNSEEVLQTVKNRYDKAAESYGTATKSCCAVVAAGDSAGFAAQHGLYTPSDLESVPEVSVKLSRGCGNPVGFAELGPGEVVVDLGCGAGIDVILAARRVTPGGKVIGVDFAPHMIERARQSVGESGLSGSVEFVLGDLGNVQLPNDSANVIISNCVINLCPHKDAVYHEAFRILKPGGRIAISDIEYTEKADPVAKSRFEAAWAGCVGGSIEESTYLEIVRRAGFTDVQVIARHSLGPAELEEMASCPGPEFAPAPQKEDLAQVQGKVMSIKFTAAKPLHRQ